MRTLQGYVVHLEKEMYPRFGQRAMKDMTSADVQGLVYRKREGGHPAAAGQLRNLLKRMFDYAVANGLLSVNPALTIPMRFITQSRSRDRALSAREIRLSMEGIYSSNIRRQFKLSLHIILLPLVRKGELLHARWENWADDVENLVTERKVVVGTFGDTCVN